MLSRTSISNQALAGVDDEGVPYQGIPRCSIHQDRLIFWRHAPRCKVVLRVAQRGARTPNGCCSVHNLPCKPWVLRAHALCVTVHPVQGGRLEHEVHCAVHTVYSICVLPYHCTIRRIDDSRWHLCLKYANMPGASKHIHGTVQYGTLRTHAASMRPSGLFQRE